MNHLQQLSRTVKASQDDRDVLWAICGRTKSAGITKLTLKSFAKSVGLPIARVKESIRCLNGNGFIRVLDNFGDSLTVEPNGMRIATDQVGAREAADLTAEKDRGSISIEQTDAGLRIEVVFSKSPKLSTTGKMLELCGTGGFIYTDIEFGGKPIGVNLYVGATTRVLSSSNVTTKKAN